MPHGRRGDMSLPTVPKSRWVNHKNNQRNDNDEGFSEQARCCAARRYWSWDRRWRAAGVRPELSVAQHHGDHPVRARQCQRHHRAHRARAGRQADGPAHHHRQPRRRRRHHRRRPGGARRRRTATPSCSIRRRSAPPMSRTRRCPTTRSTISSRWPRSASAERAGGRAVEGMEDRRRSDRRRQGQARRDELRLGRHRRGLASCRGKIQRRRRHQGPARSVQGAGRGADRGDGRPHRLLFPAARAGAGADQGRQGHGAGGQLRQARAVAARRADHGRGRVAEGGLRVLERRVRSGEDAAGRGQEALRRDAEGDRRSGRQGAAGQARASSRCRCRSRSSRNTSRPT